MRLALRPLWLVRRDAAAGIAMASGHRQGTIPLAGRPPPTSLFAALAGLGALVFAYASSGLLQAWPWAALAAYVVVWLAIVWRVHGEARRSLVLHSLGTAAIGPLVEIVISSTGAFTYAHPDVAGVALWLPGIYLNAAAASHLMDRHLMAREAASS